MRKTKAANSTQKTATIQTKSGERYTTEEFFDPEGNKASRRYTSKEIEEINLLKEEQGIIDDEIDCTFFTRCFENDGTIYITAHAYERMKERNGWNAKTAERMAARIYENGKDTRNITGKLHLWAKKKLKNYGSYLTSLIYGDKLYIFCKTTMVTVINIPTERGQMRLLNGTKSGVKKTA